MHPHARPSEPTPIHSTQRALPRPQAWTCHPSLSAHRHTPPRPPTRLRCTCDPSSTAACHSSGHPRGCPGAPGPRRRGAGGTPQPGPPASGAAWAARVRARGALGMTGVRGGTRGRRGEDCGAGPCTPPPGSARYRPGSEAAASPHAVATAQSPPPAPRRPRPLRALPPDAGGRARGGGGAAGHLVRQSAASSCRLPPGSFMPVPTGFGPLAAWLGQPQGLCTAFARPMSSIPKSLHLHVDITVSLRVSAPSRPIGLKRSLSLAQPCHCHFCSWTATA